MLIMFDCKISEMSYAIYHNVHKTEIQGMDKEDRGEMLEEIYESGDDFRTQTDSNTNRQQPFQSAGSYMWIRSYRSVTVCLVLLCVLLLTAVIVLCVLINTNNQQWHIETKNLIEERDQLLTKYTNITEERDQLLTNKTNLTEERDKIIAKYNDITKLREQLNQEKNELWTHLQDGWIYYQFSLYFISSEKKTWTESRIYCRERGADLIIINNKEEQDFIQKCLVKDGLWIGLTDSEVEGKWKWVDNSTLNSGFWRSGEPNGGTTENCVESYSSEWNDLSCNMARNWICERH